MPDEEDAPKPEEKESGSGTGDAAADAKQLLNKGVATFKKIELSWQIYLVALLIVVIGALFFSAMSFEWKAKGAASGLETVIGMEKKWASGSAFEVNWKGKIAVLAALAGIGIFIWNRLASRKEPWVPLALIGCAGVSALALVILWLSVDTPSSSGMGIMGGSLEIDLDMGILGFWIPLLAAIGATVVSVKELMKA